MRSRTFTNLFAGIMVVLLLLTVLLISSVRISYGLDGPLDEQPSALVIDADSDVVFSGS